MCIFVLWLQEAVDSGWLLKRGRACAACKSLLAAALAREANWRELNTLIPNTDALLAHAKRVKAIVVAAWPNPSSRPPIVQEAEAAVQSALAVANEAKLRVEASRAALEATLIALRDHATAAAVAWEDRPPSSEERQGLLAAISAARDAMEAHPGLHQPSTLQQANDALAKAWAAADAAQAAHAERALAAQHALERFTQRALLCRAAWARPGRRREPKRDKYEKLHMYYNQAMSLAQRAFPEAHEYVCRAAMEPGAQPDNVPEGEVLAVTLMQDARSALESVKGLVRAWEYVSEMQQAAVAA